METVKTITEKHITDKTMAQCKCCEREKELRFGFCFDCAECESVIETNLDMWDNEITKVEGFSDGMSKLFYILKKFNVTSTNPSSSS